MPRHFPLTRFAPVTLADRGSLTDIERSLLLKIGGDLVMTPTHSRGVVDSAIEHVNRG